MHYKPMHPWRRCVVMDRMWMTMAKSVSMAGIIMGRMPHLMGDGWEGQRNEYPNDNNHLHHPPTTHPTKGHTILQHVDVVHP